MAEGIWSGGGMVMAYGVFIANALKAKGVSLQELAILRDQVRAIVDSQGNLVEALAELEKEIEKRGNEPGAKTSGVKSTPSTPLTAQRFLVHLGGIDLAAAAVQRIEQRMKDAVLEEIAKMDLKREFVATPLSDVKSWGGGLGGATAGMFIEPRL
jgi:hypothetical protein